MAEAMNRIENTLSSTGSSESTPLGSNTVNPIRRSARIQERNLRRLAQAQLAQAAAAQKPETVKKSVKKTKKIRRPVEVGGGTVAAESAQALVPPVQINEEQPEEAVKMETPATFVNIEAVQGGSVQMSTSDQQGGEGAGRKRSAEGTASADSFIEEKRGCYEDAREEPRQEKSTQVESEEPEIARAYQGLPKPVAIKPVAPTSFVIRAPMQPPHLPMPQYSMGHGAFHMVQPRRMEMDFRQQQQQQQMQQQLQLYDNSHFQNPMPPPPPPPPPVMNMNIPPPLPLFQWEDIPPPAPVMQIQNVNVDYFNNNNNNFGAYAPPQVAEQMPLHYANRRINADDTSSHSILVQILNSGVANVNAGNNNADPQMYGGMGFEEYQDPNANQYGQHQHPM